MFAICNLEPAYPLNDKCMKRILSSSVTILIVLFCHAQQGILVLQTDFGLKDGAVAAMKGVAMKVSANLKIFDLTHDIPVYDIWQAAYRLEQTAGYWPSGTVFVSVVDPGVGSERKSIVAKTKSGHYFVTPDNGTLTLVAASLGIDEVRIIDEKLNRLPGSNASYTFHGRDVFAYIGARLAAKKISFRQVGSKLVTPLTTIRFQQAVIKDSIIRGTIPILDVQYGNVWTNIPGQLLKKINLKYGDSLQVEIYDNDTLKFHALLPYVKTFSDVRQHQPLAYLNSLLNFSLAINRGDFAKQHQINCGPDWRIILQKSSGGQKSDLQ